MAANEEFASEVTRLYEEEARWVEERTELTMQMETITEELREQLRAGEENWAEERRRMEEQEQRLVESVKMVSGDNDKLIREREEEQASQSKSHQVVVSSSAM